jgi:NifB/MoaA-like Fe-S oxidoreductase
MLRLFQDQWQALSSETPVVPGCVLRRVTLVTGALFAPTLKSLSEQIAGRIHITIRVRPIVNCLFGPSVTVAGLLTAKDVVAALRDEKIGDLLVLPSAMFDASGTRSLDDWTTKEISEALGNIPLAVAGTPGELLAVIGEREA